MATQQSFTPEEAQKRFEALPPEVKKMLYSTEMMTTLRQIADKNQLHIDQLGLLEAETGAVMLGFTETKDYPQMLVEALRIDRIKADAIAQNVNDMLFLKIRESMKKVQSQETASSSSTPNASTPPTPASPAPKVPEVPKTPIEVHPADVMLSQKTISVPPTLVPTPSTPAPVAGKAPEAPKPASYKTDPYREPPEA